MVKTISRILIGYGPMFGRSLHAYVLCFGITASGFRAYISNILYLGAMNRIRLQHLAPL
jgi:hypothetical protein